MTEPQPTTGDVRAVQQFVMRALTMLGATAVADGRIRVEYRGTQYELALRRLNPPTTTTSPGGTSPGTTPTAPRTGTVADRVLDHINTARAAAGRNPLVLDDAVTAAATAHTQLMINGGGLTHQGRGEPKLGDRLTAAGSRWRRCAENVGYASTTAGDDALVRSADQMTDRMLAETPPDDGHRRNLLEPAYTRCGLAVLRDARGTAWMTQDFTD